MPSSIPLLRASAVAPLEAWLRARGEDPAPLFRSAGLPASTAADPERPVSFHAYFHLLDRLSVAHGPDLGCRIADSRSLLLLGAPARAARAGATPREALLNVARHFHRHASHAFFLVAPAEGGLLVTESMPMGGSESRFHAAQQHVASFVASLGALAGTGPLPCRVRMVPHPEHGLAHLAPWLGPDISAGPARRLEMFVPDRVLDLPLRWGDAPPLEALPPLPPPLRPETLSASARVLIAGMLGEGEASLDQLALMAGRSRRTLQRLLATEGTSFAELLDSVRAEGVLGKLREGQDGVARIASLTGYRSPSSLTRAVRRWADASPRQLRQAGRG